jgi:hypothetical protein
MNKTHHLYREYEETMFTPGGMVVYFSTSGRAIRKHLELLRDLSGDSPTGICPRCKTKWKLTLDHIVPQYILDSLGLQSRKIFISDNLELMCERCNSTKGHHIETTNPKALYILKELIGLIESRQKQEEELENAQ